MLTCSVDPPFSVVGLKGQIVSFILTIFLVIKYRHENTYMKIPFKIALPE